MITATAPTTRDGIELTEGAAVLIHEADGTTTYAIVQGVTPNGRAHVITGADLLTGKRRYVPCDQLTSTLRVVVYALREWVIVNHAHPDEVTVGPMTVGDARGLLSHWYETADTSYGMAHFMRRGTRAELASLAE